MADSRNNEAGQQSLSKPIIVGEKRKAVEGSRDSHLTDSGPLPAFIDFLSVSFPHFDIAAFLLKPGAKEFCTAMVSLVSAAVALSGGTGEVTEVARLKAEISEQKTKAKGLRSLLAESNLNLARAIAKVNDSENRVKRLQDSFEGRIDILRKQVRKLESENSDLRVNIIAESEIGECRVNEAVEAAEESAIASFKLSDEFRNEFLNGVDRALAMVVEKFPDSGVDVDGISELIEMDM